MSVSWTWGLTAKLKWQGTYSLVERLELNISDTGLAMHVPLIIFDHSVDYVLWLPNEFFVVGNHLDFDEVGVNLLRKAFLGDEPISVHISRLFRLLNKADCVGLLHAWDGFFVLHLVPQVDWPLLKQVIIHVGLLFFAYFHSNIIQFLLLLTSS